MISAISVKDRLKNQAKEDGRTMQRYFKERGIKFQFIDMSEKEMSKGKRSF